MPEFIKLLALLRSDLCNRFHQHAKKTCELIINSGNQYLAALKGNQPSLFKSVKENFIAEESDAPRNKGHGRIEKRTVSICINLDGVKPWIGLKTMIRVESERQFTRGGRVHIKTETRYYIASFIGSAQEFARRIRGYWGVENKVHYVRSGDSGRGAVSARDRTFVWESGFGSY